MVATTKCIVQGYEIEEVSDDGPLSPQSPVNEMELDPEPNHLLLEETHNCNVEVSNLINSNAPVHQLQRVQGAPINIYTCTNAEQMDFPWLHLDGTNGYKLT